MSGIDNRIVTMKFDNAQFESGARTTMSTLQRLKDGMNFGTIGASASKALGGLSGLFAKFGIKNPFSTAEKGAADLSKAAGGVASGGMTTLDGAVTGVSNRFLAMSTIAITALSNITTKAMQTGQQMVSALTVDPIKGGLEEYETNLNSIQTILANTKVSGANLQDVNTALDELNTYSDKTIYNFSEMARNIGTFTAAGVDLDTSVASIKGIANLAALSGSNSQQASTAMYQLSQEIAAGRVSLMGWNSVVNAGMGGSTFQRALVNTAQTMGTLNGRTVEFQGKMKNATIDGQSFRDSIMAKPGEQSWLSKEVLTGTLAQFTGDMTKAELAAEGFTEAQIKDIQEMAKTASDAATKVKTLSGVFDTAKEVVGSGWAKTWQLVFGDFKEARKFFTNFSIGFNDILDGISDKRNEVLAEWKLAGGRDLAIEGLKTMWESMLTILKPVGKAFRDIFPAATSDNLLSMTRNFVEFAKNLRISKATAGGLKDTFRGVFAIFSIIGQVLGAVVDGLQKLFGAVSEGSGGFLDFTGGLGNAIVAFDTFLEKSGILQEFFGSIAGILTVPIRLISEFAGVLGTMFSSFDAGGAGGAIGSMTKFGETADGLAVAAETVVSIFSSLGGVLSKAGDLIVNTLTNIGDAISSAITPETFASSLSVINTALLGGIVLMLRRFFSGGINIDVGGGFFQSVAETLGAATEVLQNMQANLKADILMKLAGALGIMALSLLLLASIDAGDLTKALAAMSAGFAVLAAVMITLIKYMGPIGALKMPLIAAGMIGLATALLLFAGAMKILGGMDLYEIARGLVAIGGVLFVIQKAMVPMAAGAGGMIRAAAAILILGVALNVLAGAVKLFSMFSWEEMGKGLAGVIGSLTAIAIAMRLMPKGMLLQAAAILVLSVSLNALAAAMKIFATMSWTEIGKGLTALAASLVVIGVAMRRMPKSMPITAAGLILVSVALNAIAAALKVMATMSWEEIGKGLVTLGGALLILSAGLNSMGPMALLGAAALTVATAALAALTPVLVTLGSLEWSTIVKALTALAGVFVVLGLAGYILGPLVPVLIGLGAAMVLIGAGLVLAGAGALIFATAFAVVVAAGTAGVKLLSDILVELVNAIPSFFAAIGKGLVSMAVAIAKNSVHLTRAMVIIMNSMLDAVIKTVPKMAKAFLVMLVTALRVIEIATPRIIDAGFNLIVSFLRAIEKNIGQIVNLAASIIVKFIDGIAQNLGKIIQAGVNLIIKFVEGVADAIRNNSERMGAAGGDLAVAMVQGMVKGIQGGAGAISSAALSAARAAWDEVKNFFKIKSPSRRMRDEIGARIPQGMALGIKDDTPLVVKEIGEMGKTAVGKLGHVMKGVEDALMLDPNLNPTITPVLDLTALTKEANKMSSILTTAPIMAGVSYETAANISAMTQPSSDPDNGPDDSESGGGDQYNELNLHLHSPKPIDSVEAYRGGKTLISLAKEALK